MFCLCQWLCLCQVRECYSWEVPRETDGVLSWFRPCPHTQPGTPDTSFRCCQRTKHCWDFNQITILIVEITWYIYAKVFTHTLNNLPFSEVQGMKFPSVHTEHHMGHFLYEFIYFVFENSAMAGNQVSHFLLFSNGWVINSNLSG